MPALAPRADPVSGASTGHQRPFLKRQRSVAAVAPAACVEMSREKFARHVVAAQPSAPPATKRVCRGFDVKIGEKVFTVRHVSVDPASASGPLKQRMEAERDALDSLLKKAALLSRAAVGKNGARIVAAERQPEARKQSTEPKKQQRVAPRTTKGAMASRIDKAKEAMKKRRLEEIARAREKFRQELIEMEKAAMPDETIYPEDLEELGITAYQYDVTRTRKQSPLGSGSTVDDGD
ncbi:hypothetical protein QOZ80_5AG0374000 [Eleusine coracana subsp. coracana]|nr:hypothetical protein QOZ80_5AG0374000 [Eleusine coracana subsp. coracana]